MNLLGVQTFTNAIYKVYNGAFDRDAALQLGTFLVSVTLTLLVIERATRGRARYAAEGGRRFTPIRLHGPAAVAAVAAPLALVALVVLAPVVQLAVWSAQSISDGLLAPEFATAARNSLLLAVMSIALVVGAALVLAYGRRVSRSATAGRAVRVATIGYGVPGSVVAVAVLVPLGWIDHRLDDAAGVGLILTGTVICLFVAYTVRFVALAFQSVDSGLERVPQSLDDAARGLGSDRLDVLARVHVPLIWGAMATAGLLVFTEVMRELPATLLLRPLGGDTLAVAVWQATTESLYVTAALPALLIVLVGLGPRRGADPPVAEDGVRGAPVPSRQLGASLGNSRASADAESGPGNVSVALHDVAKSFGTTRAVAGVDLDCPAASWSRCSARRAVARRRCCG